MNIILTCLTNFQEYILINIYQLIKLENKNIYVITNKNLFKHFEIVKSYIHLIDADELIDSFNFNSKTTLDNNYRGGFWKLTSQRFFVIYEFMKKHSINDVIHLENDVLIYYNCDELENYLDKKFMYIPFDSYNRNIASIIYIPNIEVFKIILDRYNVNKNDMENFSIIKKQTNLIENFPIFPEQYAKNNEELFVSKNSKKFPYIFDAAAIGQYIGGVDPRNISGDTRGFVNETCVIKYNNYNIYFKEHNCIKRPFLSINDKEIPIFNLHIHSKNLHMYY